MTLTEIKHILAQRQLSPLKQLGQNFLHDQNLASAIALRALPQLPAAEHASQQGNAVVEIGPGLGSLTEYLLPRLEHIPLILLEKDRGLCEVLRERLQNEISAGKVVLIEGDALETLPKLGESGFRPTAILGNLPYNISTPLLMQCWEHFPMVRTLFLLQKEVGQRLASPPGSKVYGALSVILQTFYEIELVRNVPGTVFYPAPEIHSVIVECRPIPSPLVSLEERKSFAEIVHTGFSQRRKKLSNLLNCTDQRRAEQLSPKEWVDLWKSLKGN